MATATLATTRFGIGAVAMNEPKQLRPDLQEVVADILALKAMERNERFITHKAQREILNKLNADDLAAVARAIAAAEKQQLPIYTRNK
jgi:hypothetical protein